MREGRRACVPTVTAVWVLRIGLGQTCTQQTLGPLWLLHMPRARPWGLCLILLTLGAEAVQVQTHISAALHARMRYDVVEPVEQASPPSRPDSKTATPQARDPSQADWKAIVPAVLQGGKTALKNTLELLDAAPSDVVNKHVLWQPRGGDFLPCQFDVTLGRGWVPSPCTLDECMLPERVNDPVDRQVCQSATDIFCMVKPGDRGCERMLPWFAACPFRDVPNSPCNAPECTGSMSPVTEQRCLLTISAYCIGDGKGLHACEAEWRGRLSKCPFGMLPAQEDVVSPCTVRECMAPKSVEDEETCSTTIKAFCQAAPGRAACAKVGPPASWGEAITRKQLTQVNIANVVNSTLFPIRLYSPSNAQFIMAMGTLMIIILADKRDKFTPAMKEDYLNAAVMEGYANYTVMPTKGKDMKYQASSFGEDYALALFLTGIVILFIMRWVLKKKVLAFDFSKDEIYTEEEHTAARNSAISSQGFSWFVGFPFAAAFGVVLLLQFLTGAEELMSRERRDTIAYARANVEENGVEENGVRRPERDR